MGSLRTLFSCFVLVFFLLTFSEARDFLVGGKENSWEIPSSPDDLNKWAENSRFLIGDFLVWKYDAKSDSVLQVTEENYKSCNKAKPIKAFKDGDTKIELDRSGLFYFISGAEGHCEKGQKLVVRVLSAKHGSRGSGSLSPSPAPAPFPAVFLAPAPGPGPGPNSAGHRPSGGWVWGVAKALGSLVGLVLI